jgi:hypothetical protein
MKNIVLSLAALAATSCSLQLDSQYGLRWDRRVPADRTRTVERENTGGFHESPAAAPAPTAAASEEALGQGTDSKDVLMSFGNDPVDPIAIDGSVSHPTPELQNSTTGITPGVPNPNLDVTKQEAKKMPYLLTELLVALGFIAVLALSLILFFVGLAWVLLYEWYWLDEIFILWGILLMIASVALVWLARKVSRGILSRARA